MKTTQGGYLSRQERNGDSEGVRVKKVLSALPRFSGGMMPGRSTAEGGREEKDEKNTMRGVEKVVLNAAVSAGPVDSTTSGALAAVERSPSGVLAGEPCQRESKLGLLACGERARGEVRWIGSRMVR